MAKSQKLSRLFFVASADIKEHFSRYKWIYVILISVCIAGIIAGFVAGFRKAEDIALEDLPDSTLLSFINKDITAFSVFFSRIFSFIGLFMLVWACSFSSYLCFITIILLIYRSFLLAINCAILIVLYKMGGIINVVLIFLPFHLIVLFALLMWCVICLEQSFSCRRTGISVFSSYFIKQHRSCIITCFCLVFFSYLLESMFMPYISTLVLIGVS